MKIVNAALYKKAGNSTRELILPDNALPSTRKKNQRKVPSLLKKNHDARHCAPADNIALRIFTLISFIRGMMTVCAQALRQRPPKETRSTGSEGWLDQISK
jgi:hypothetical protein